jgi:beta-galactosidase
MVRVEALDSQGRLVPTAGNTVTFNVTGTGKLIGVGNGDPNCQESDKGPRRSLFNGLAQAIIQSTKSAGEIQVEVTTRGPQAGGRAPVRLAITSRQVQLRPSVPTPRAS